MQFLAKLLVSVGIIITCVLIGRQVAFPYVIGASFAAWLVAAAVHQWLLAK